MKSSGRSAALLPTVTPPPLFLLTFSPGPRRAAGSRGGGWAEREKGLFLRVAIQESPEVSSHLLSDL